MPEMEIVPYARFGPVPFNATEEEIVDILGAPESTRALQHTGGRQLHYSELGIHINLDAAGRCESVESVEPSHCVPVIDGDMPLVGDVEAVAEALRRRGFDTQEGPEAGDVFCDAFGISLWREYARSRTIDSVCAFRRDAYQQVAKMDMNL